MFIQVKLLNGCQKRLTYTVPVDWSLENLTGALVSVPVKARKELALVESVMPALTEPVPFVIKQAYAREQIPDDPVYFRFIAQLSTYYALDQSFLLKRIRHFLIKQHEEIRSEQIINTIHNPYIPSLTQEQQAIVDQLIHPITTPSYYPVLLHGVTGSGKTEVYKALIMHALSQHKSVLILLPEVALAVRFYLLFKQQLPSSVPLYSFHSATSVAEKRALWEKLTQKEPLVIIGVHMPLLLPIPRLGLIIIDEEHETGYQEKKHPKINTKEAALMRAQTTGIPVICGSATPSIASLYNVHYRNWRLCTLQKRFAGAFPVMKRVQLSKSKRPFFWISAELEQALQERLDKQEQSIIFLNRRGYYFFMQCKTCGTIISCTSCSVSLTVHNNKQLICHYCTFTMPEPDRCVHCKASAYIKKGIGTQQLVTLLQKLFPKARIARADTDATVNKKRWQQMMADFQAGSIDILVGTQTITKGYDFPRVTLVGILWADMHLGLPLYNAAEVALQQIIQVAGRAGRHTAHSEVIVQHIMDHPLFSYLNEPDYLQFYQYEFEKRQLVGYPPCLRLAEIELRNTDEQRIEHESDTLTQELMQLSDKAALSVTICGPVRPVIHTVQHIHRRKIYLKAARIQDILRLYAVINKRLYTSLFFFTPNPLS